jgi:hypothetical protein
LLKANSLRIARRHFKAYGQAAIASLLAGLVLLLNALAASPSLHEWFHHDANEPEHQCAVTMFAHGTVDTASVEVPLSVPLTFVEAVPSVGISVFSPVIENLPAGRAPPVLPAVS